MQGYDKIIFGAGFFGLYAALQCINKNERVLVLEYDDMPFKRASWINQARLHHGYHYPRSYATAKKAAYYFDRFVNDYAYAIVKDFKKVYATSQKYSYTNAQQFLKFCSAANIPCELLRSDLFFKDNMCDGVFETNEYTFDAKIISEALIKQLNANPNFTINYNSRLSSIKEFGDKYHIVTNHGSYETPFVVNATYANINQILVKANLEPFKMKYELCEIILCKVSNSIKNVGITIMDGPFFSLMPFGKTEYHSLTSVGSTPHLVCRKHLPEFNCQHQVLECDQLQLADCNNCLAKPKTAFMDMFKLAKTYLKDEIDICYHQSLFSMKAILLASEIDDSRPTIIKFANNKPKFLSVFSGKINSIYDLDGVL